MSSDQDNGGDKTMIMAPSALSGHKQPAPRARLVCKNPDILGSPAGQEILLDVSAVTIGRSPEHDVSLKADGISRNHAKFFPGDGAWGVEDMGSTNGVLVNGSKAQQAWLKPGDLIVVGTVQYAYELLQVEASAADDESDAMREAEKTVVMRPTVKREVTADAPAPPKPAPAAVPPARTPTQTGAASARPAARSSSPREAPSGSGSGMKLIIALVVVVAAAVGFLFFK